MDPQTRIDTARHFHALHQRGDLLLLPNAWDAGSARLFASLGYAAIATTSGGMAWALGYADGEQAPLDEVLGVVRRIVRCTSLPVSVDFEGGFADTVDGVGNNVRALIETGAVGLNLEEGIRHESLRGIGDAADRIAAAREAAASSGVPVFINARIDCWMMPDDTDGEARLDETIRRAEAYLAAGADGIYPIGVSDPDLIGRLCASIDAPINIGARAGLANVQTLNRLGVARVSTATRLSSVAFSAAHSAAHALREGGSFDGLNASFGYEDAQALFD